MPVRYDASGLLHQHAQKLVLGRREMDLFAATENASPEQIDLDLADAHNRLRRSGGNSRAMESSAHARQQFGRTEWLGDKVVSALVQRTHLDVFFAMRGQDEHGHFAPLTHPPTHFN